nr:AMP-binding protein [Rhodococcus wratislaviensis]GLK33174.1 ATP-dependent acyl-CoA ligase [Rhodococcus wratislaviensis]
MGRELTSVYEPIGRETAVASAPASIEEYTLPSLIARWAGECPTRVFVVEAETGLEVTYGDVAATASSWADLLAASGTKSGDRIITIFDWCVEAVTTWCGIAMLGAVDASISPSARGQALIHQVNLIGASTVITDRSGLEQLGAVRHALTAVTHVVVVDDGSPVDEHFGFTVEIVPPDVRYRDRRGQRQTSTRPLPKLYDTARLSFTSGTTGPSKAVVVPWGSLIQGAMASSKADYDSTDRIYITSPCTHITGRMLMLMTAMLGASAVVRPHFKTRFFWPDIKGFGCTMTTLVAAMSNFLINQPPSEDDAANPLRYLNMVPIHPAYEEFKSRFGVKITSGYGCTEAIKVLSHGWDIEDPRSCGRVSPGWPGLEARIVDENDAELPDGTAGELIVRSDVPWTLNAGYLDDPEATATAWRNGWFHTGDMMKRDERGLYFFVDRARDSIRRRGINIASFDVEAEVLQHPDVLECAAVGVKVDETEEEIKVFVVLRPTSNLEPSDLIDFLKKNVSRHMVPRFVHFIHDLPRNDSHRVQKFILKEAPREGEYDSQMGLSAS